MLPFFFLMILLPAAFSLLVLIACLVGAFKLGWWVMNGLGGFLLLIVVLMASLFWLRSASFVHSASKITQMTTAQPALLEDEPVHSPIMLPHDSAGHEQISHRLPPLVPSPVPVAPLDTVPASSFDAAVLNAPISVWEIHRDESGTIVNRISLEEIPDWVKEEHASEHTDTQQAVVQTLHSERFATAEEARTHLWPQLQRKLLQELRPVAAGIHRWNLKLKDALRAGVILKECEVTWPLKIGEFEEHVIQVHWQVLLSDGTQQQLLTQWKPVIVRQRLFQLASLCGIMMCLFATGAYLLRPH